MMSQPTAEQLQALVHLSSTPEWRRIDAIFEGEYLAILDRLVEGPDDLILRRLQGRAKMLKDFRELVASAPTSLGKLTKR